MAVDKSPPAESGDFDLLTDKQVAVLGPLANGRTSKEIAGTLGLSESAVNRRIELLRIRFGGITRLELARRYRDWAAVQGASDGVETDRQSLRLAEPAAAEQKPVEDGEDAALTFRDSVAISIAPPWTGAAEPNVVPRVLDGENAVLTRGAAIAVMLLATVATLVLGLAAAGALTEMLGH